jgi:hypothetical protein
MLKYSENVVSGKVFLIAAMAQWQMWMSTFLHPAPSVGIHPVKPKPNYMEFQRFVNKLSRQVFN